MTDVFSLKGSTVKVVKGRKVPVGTVGECFWVGRNKFARGKVEYRIGMKDAKGVTHWTAAQNVMVVGFIEFAMARDAATSRDRHDTDVETAALSREDREERRRDTLTTTGFQWSAFGGDENGDFEDCPESANDERGF